jgi:SAM-dependent methyltransferase
MWVIDRLLFPLLVFLSPERSRQLGLTPIDDERIDICLKYARGALLDVGCGFNRLARQYPGPAVGVDVFRWPGVSLLARSDRMPFRSESFETVTMTAVLNHIPAPDRVAALVEVRRVLKGSGVLLLTMIPPWVGSLSHPIRYPHDPDQHTRGLSAHESLGLTDRQVRSLLAQSGFRVERRVRFLWFMNNLYVCRRDAVPGQAGA